MAAFQFSTACSWKQQASELHLSKVSFDMSLSQRFQTYCSHHIHPFCLLQLFQRKVHLFSCNHVLFISKMLHLAFIHTRYNYWNSIWLFSLQTPHYFLLCTRSSSHSFCSTLHVLQYALFQNLVKSFWHKCIWDCVASRTTRVLALVIKIVELHPRKSSFTIFLKHTTSSFLQRFHLLPQRYNPSL